MNNYISIIIIINRGSIQMHVLNCNVFIREKSSQHKLGYTFKGVSKLFYSASKASSSI